MSHDPLEYLGLSCPSGGRFHICQDSTDRFIGCCDVDPCGDGGCPSSRIHPAGFNVAQYNKIPSQDCDDTSPGASWYTCTSGPFLGCCKSNPCNQNGVCPDGNLVAGRLANDPNMASVFLTTSAPTATVTLASSSSIDAGSGASNQAPSSTAGSGDEASPHKTASGMIGGIVGGVIGGLVLLALAIFLLCRYKKHRKNGGTICPAEEEGQVTIPNQLGSPYPDVCKDNDATFLPPDSSPYLNASARQHHRRSIPRSIFSPLWPNARFSTTKDKYEPTAHERRTSYDPSNRVQSSGFSAVAELEASMPILELDSTAPGQVPTSQSFRGILYHEVEGSMAKTEGT